MERLTVNDLNKVCYDPWELCGMDSYCKKGCHEEGGCTKGCHILKIYRKLAEYEDMEEQGKLLRLPCKVGDTVYQHMIVGVDMSIHKPIYEIAEAIVFKFSLDSFTLCFWTQTIEKGKQQNELPLSAFGKSVFLTREEAEDALKELEGKEE